MDVKLYANEWSNPKGILNNSKYINVNVLFQGMVVTGTLLKEIFRHLKGNTEVKKTYIHAKV